jgi:hypothetical protein
MPLGRIQRAYEMQCWRQAIFPMAKLLGAAPEPQDDRASMLELEGAFLAFCEHGCQSACLHIVS